MRALLVSVSARELSRGDPGEIPRLARPTRDTARSPGKREAESDRLWSGAASEARQLSNRIDVHRHQPPPRARSTVTHRGRRRISLRHAVLVLHRSRCCEIAGRIANLRLENEKGADWLRIGGGSEPGGGLLQKGNRVGASSRRHPRRRNIVRCRDRCDGRLLGASDQRECRCQSTGSANPFHICSREVGSGRKLSNVPCGAGASIGATAGLATTALRYNCSSGPFAASATTLATPD